MSRYFWKILGTVSPLCLDRSGKYWELCRHNVWIFLEITGNSAATMSGYFWKILGTVLPQCLAISGKYWEQRRNAYCDISRKYWENCCQYVCISVR
jgi:hypothetical protein